LSKAITVIIIRFDPTFNSCDWANSGPSSDLVPKTEILEILLATLTVYEVLLAINAGVRVPSLTVKLLKSAFISLGGSIIGHPIKTSPMAATKKIPKTFVLILISSSLL